MERYKSGRIKTIITPRCGDCPSYFMGECNRFKEFKGTKIHHRTKACEIRIAELSTNPEIEIYLAVKIECREKKCPDRMKTMHTRCATVCKHNRNYHWKKLTKAEWKKNGSNF